MNKLSVLKNKGYWFVAESTIEGFPWKIAITFNKTGMVLSTSSITTSGVERKNQRRAYIKKYAEENKDEHEKSIQLWRERNPEKFAAICRRRNYKRYRNLGFEPLNEWFPDSEAHHINKDVIIYISKELHKSVYHKLSSGVGMEKINKLAFEWLDRELIRIAFDNLEEECERQILVKTLGKPRGEIQWG